MTLLLARTIRFDGSDGNVFARPAGPGEWAVTGGFEFSNWSEADLRGKARQAFASGWLGLSSFGRATFVAVARIEKTELEAAAQALAGHLDTVYGAPSPEAARQAAEMELDFMLDLCAGQKPNTLLVVQRELTEAGVREQFRSITPRDAEIAQVAVHGTPDG
ncbi:MAG: DUF6505 family protein [Paracoccaceae bacterium]